jgi:hypothetical protein
MSLPTESEAFAKLTEHLRLAQESAALLAHLHNAHGLRGTATARGWLAVSENLKQMNHIVTQMATGKLN